MKENANILHIYNSYLAQSENWSYFQISSLTDTFNIHIGALHKAENNFDLTRIKTHYYPLGPQIKKSWRLSKSNIIHLAEKFLTWVKTNITHTPYEFFNNIVLDQHIELIHFHFADVCWNYMNIAIKNNIPFCVSFYGWDYEKLPHTQPNYKKRFLAIFKSATKVIVEGPHGKNILIKHGCPKEKIQIIKLGVPRASIQNQPIEKAKNELKLIQISALKEKKGVLDTIQAFNDARRSFPNISLTIGGDSQDEAYKNQILKLIDQLGLQKNIKLLGRVDLNSLNDVLKQHHVFIHPSQYASNMDCEGGAPIVILNAQACGLPVISTTHCDIPQEVIQNSTGILVHEKSPAELVDAIIRFYKMEKQTFHEFSLRSIEHVSNEFDIQENAKQLSSLYNILIKQSQN